MKAKMKLFIALLCVLIACIAWSPGVLAAPAVAETAADPVLTSEISPLNGNRTIQQIAADPKVAPEIEAAWAASNADNATTRHEEGGWIYEDMSGNLSVHRWPSGERDSITPDPPTPPEGGRLVGEFHTHPNPPVDENNKKWEQGPSETDKNTKPPGTTGSIIRNGGGLQYY